MRYAAIVALIVVIGCSPDPKDDLRPLVAIGGAYGLLEADTAPLPKVDPDVCENCHGRGVVGDGVQEYPCPVCRPSSEKPPAKPPCKDGKCPVPVTRR